MMPTVCHGVGRDTWWGMQQVLHAGAGGPLAPCSQSLHRQPCRRLHHVVSMCVRERFMWHRSHKWIRVHIRDSLGVTLKAAWKRCVSRCHLNDEKGLGITSDAVCGVPDMQLVQKNGKQKKVKVAHTRLPSVGFRSWSRFLAVSLQVTWVINPAVGCHYFPPGLQLPPQPLRGLLPILLLGEQRHNGCEQFA